MEVKWKHLAVMAIQKTTTGSISRTEIQDFISREYPGFPLNAAIHTSSIQNSRWFLNIGFKALRVWTINPEQQADIDTELEAIFKGKRSLRKLKLKPDDMQPLNTRNFQMDLSLKSAHASIRELINANNSNGCTIRELQEIATRSGWHLHYPELENSRDTKINLVDIDIRPNCKVFSISHSIMTEHYKQILKWSSDNEEKIRASMKNPNHFGALLQGDLKHGFDLSLDMQKSEHLIVWNVISTMKTKENQGQDHDFPKPPYSTDQLIVLAYKNSCSGQLNALQLKQFISNHFPGFSINNARYYNHLLIQHLNKIFAGRSTKYYKINCEYEAKCVKTKKIGPAKKRSIKLKLTHLIAIALLKSSTETLTILELKDFLHRENIHFYSSLQVPEEEPGTSDEDINWPETTENCESLGGSYWDRNNNEVLIDDSWTMESEGVYFKHEITIESEDPPEDSCFYDNEPPIMKKRRRVVYEEDYSF